MKIVQSLVILLAFGASAFAQAIKPGEEGPLADILAPKPGTQICHSRHYDSAHMKAHPRQLVTDITFRLAYHRFDADENYPQGQRNYYFQLLAKKKGNTRTLTASGECFVHENRIFCGVECDGGGLYMKKDGAKSLVLSFGDMWGIRMSDGCGEAEESTVMLEPGADDRAFRLEPDRICPAYEQW